MLSAKVKPRRILEYKAHFECTLDSWKTWLKEVVLFGRTVSYSIEEEALESSGLDRYDY